LCGKKKLIGGFEENGRFFCSKKCATGYKLLEKGFCKKCLSETTEQSIGGGTTFNGIGNGLGFSFFKSECPECGSVIKRKWFYLLFPLIPKGKFRVIKVLDKQGLGEQTRVFLSRRLKIQKGVKRGYIMKNLMNDEQLLFCEKIHGPKFLLPVLSLIAGYLLSNAVPILGEIVSGLGLLYFIYSLINTMVSEVGLTNKRVMIRSGLIMRKVLAVELDKVKSISAEVGIGLVSDYGNLIITTNKGETHHIRQAENPLGFETQYRKLTGKKKKQVEPDAKEI
jgi:hypothetical protein